MTQSAQAEDNIRTEDGDETATTTFYEIVQPNPSAGENKGLVIALVHTDSTGRIAPFNDMIVAGIDDIQPNGDSFLTLWEWKSRIGNSDIASVQEEPLMDTITSKLRPINMPYPHRTHVSSFFFSISELVIIAAGFLAALQQAYRGSLTALIATLYIGCSA